MYSREFIQTQPPAVQAVLKVLNVEERGLKRRSPLGKKIPLNEKSIGCICSLEVKRDNHKGQPISKEYIEFSPAQTPRKEPVRYIMAKEEEN